MGLFISILVVLAVAGCFWLANDLPRRLSASERKGSKYYVPKFKVEFDRFQPRWTRARHEYEAYEKRRWDAEFTAGVNGTAWWQTTRR